MRIKAVLFDLDGTLLPMEQDAFVHAYFGLLAKKLAPRGYEPKRLVDAIWAGTAAMVKNNGCRTNEEAFWKTFCEIFGEDAAKDAPFFEEFYHNEFQQVRQVCGFAPEASQVVQRLKARGFRVALATNPIFPAVATESRTRWAGLRPEDFELYTTYENSRYCKPNPEYYRDILAQLQLQPEECVMVGNDVGEDMVARQLGMQVFLLTDHMINRNGEDISAYPRGGFPELLAFVDDLCREEETK